MTDDDKSMHCEGPYQSYCNVVVREDGTEEIHTSGIFAEEMIKRSQNSDSYADLVAWARNPVIGPRDIVPPVEEPDYFKRNEIMSLLSAFYEDASGRYRDGFSDDRVAVYTGCTLNAVRRFREVAFGPLAKDDDAAAG